MEDITDADYMDAKRVCRDFEIKNLIFSKTFQKMCLKIYNSDSVKFISAPWLAWQGTLKKTEVNLKLLTHVDVILKRNWRRNTSSQFSNMQKLITNLWKITMKIKNHHIINIGM